MSTANFIFSIIGVFRFNSYSPILSRKILVKNEREDWIFVFTKSYLVVRIRTIGTSSILDAVIYETINSIIVVYKQYNTSFIY